MKLLTIRETAEILKVSRQYVWMNAERLGAVDLKHGEGKRRTLRIPEDSLRRYINAGAIGTDTERR